MERVPPKIKLKVAGRGPSSRKLSRTAGRRGSQTWNSSGSRTGQALKETVAGARFVVIPSECYEILPYTMLEAFSMGKPVITPNIAEFGRMIPQNGLGALFNFKDHLELAEKIEHLWNSGDQVLQMGHNARQYVERYLSAGYHYQRLSKSLRKSGRARTKASHENRFWMKDISSPEHGGMEAMTASIIAELVKDPSVSVIVLPLYSSSS